MTKRASLLALAITASLPSACVSLLGADGYEDAIVELCKCTPTADLNFLDGRCVPTLQSRLTNTNAEARSAWLSFYEENCTGEDKCGNAYACYAKPGTCSLSSCQVDEECCGYTGPGSPVTCTPDKLCVGA